MQNLLTYLNEQNTLIDPGDRLSQLIHAVLDSISDSELDDEDLQDIRAARGITVQKPEEHY